MTSDRLSMAELADLMGISYASLRRVRLRGVVPEPDGMDGPHPYWYRATAEKYLAARPRRGRPRRVGS